MPSVQVRYFGVLAGHAEARTEVLTLPEGSTLRQSLEAIAARKSDAFRATVLAGEGMSPLVRLFHNERPVEAAGLDNVLSDGDVIMFFPVVAGG